MPSRWEKKALMCVIAYFGTWLVICLLSVSFPNNDYLGVAAMMSGLGYVIAFIPALITSVIYCYNENPQRRIFIYAFSLFLPVILGSWIGLTFGLLVIGTLAILDHLFIGYPPTQNQEQGYPKNNINLKKYLVCLAAYAVPTIGARALKIFGTESQFFVSSYWLPFDVLAVIVIALPVIFTFRSYITNNIDNAEKKFKVATYGYAVFTLLFCLLNQSFYMLILLPVWLLMMVGLDKMYISYKDV